jgi:hypothetical protein
MGNVTNWGKIAYINTVVETGTVKHFVMNYTTDLQICELSTQHFVILLNSYVMDTCFNIYIIKLDATNVFTVFLSY